MCGNHSGRNHGAPGYVNNTRIEPNKEEGPDRHCHRPTKHGVMKCSMCHDYNKGVRRGKCIACDHARFDLGGLAAALEEVELENTKLATQFEERIEQQHRWSEDEVRAAGVNTCAVVTCAKDVFSGKALVHKEGVCVRILPLSAATSI